MPLKVVGAGFGRTGTNSLKNALEMLGFGPCHHMFEVRENANQLPFWEAAVRGDAMDWDAVFADYNASVDWPSAAFWRQLSDHFADAKVLLSVRPAEDWVKSIHATIYASLIKRGTDPPGPNRDRREMAYELIMNQTFEGKLGDADHAKAVFEAHIAEVQRTIPPARLLTYDVAEGWAPLCAFLGVPVPDEPFPLTNTTSEFQARIVAREKG
jgi:hypothetical protein